MTIFDQVNSLRTELVAANTKIRELQTSLKGVAYGHTLEEVQRLVAHNETLQLLLTGAEEQLKAGTQPIYNADRLAALEWFHEEALHIWMDTDRTDRVAELFAMKGYEPLITTDPIGKSVRDLPAPAMPADTMERVEAAIDAGAPAPAVMLGLYPVDPPAAEAPAVEPSTQEPGGDAT